MSTVYLFSDDQDPSFKLVGQVMPTVRNLSKLICIRVM